MTTYKAIKMETMEELIEKLKNNITYHIRPYNLGDNGETETLIFELIKRYEDSKRIEEAARKTIKAGHGYDGQEYIDIVRRSIRVLAAALEEK